MYRSHFAMEKISFPFIRCRFSTLSAATVGGNANPWIMSFAGMVHFWHKAYLDFALTIVCLRQVSGTLISLGHISIGTSISSAQKMRCSSNVTNSGISFTCAFHRISFINCFTRCGDGCGLWLNISSKKNDRPFTVTCIRSRGLSTAVGMDSRFFFKNKLSNHAMATNEFSKKIFFRQWKNDIEKTFCGRGWNDHRCRYE